LTAARGDQHASDVSRRALVLSLAGLLVAATRAERQRVADRMAHDGIWSVAVDGDASRVEGAYFSRSAPAS
jgi:hypothetical protein